jgi:cytochrome P450
MESSQVDTFFSLNPYDLSFRTDPYATFDILRATDPLHRTKLGTWAVTSYSLANSIIKDPRFEVDNLPFRLNLKSICFNLPELAELSKNIEHWLFFLNPPGHSRLRRTLSPFFTQHSILRLKLYIGHLVEGILGKLPSLAEIDIIEDLAAPVSKLSIIELLGLDHGSSEQVSLCAETFRLFDQPISLEVLLDQSRIMERCVQFFRDELKRNHQSSRIGLLHSLINQQCGEDALSDEEIVSLCVLLAATSQESVKGLIGNAILALLHSPESYQVLRQNPLLIEPAVEELIRFDSPVQFVARKATQDLELAGKSIRKDDFVIIYLGAVNRDPDVFQRPNILDFTRTQKNFGFGGGIHYCIGASLAKLELETILSCMVARFSSLAMATSSPMRTDSSISRRLDSLPLFLSTV